MSILAGLSAKEVVITAIGRETGKWKWAFFSALYSTTIAWAIAVIGYNVAQYFNS